MIQIRRRSWTVIAVTALAAGLTGPAWLSGTGPASAAVTATAKPVAIAAPGGVNGYTILDANGNVYNFGTTYLGGAGTDKVAPFVAMAYTPSGQGYALLDSDGHVYNYGDSRYRGGAPAGASKPFRAIAYQPGTLGYTLMDSKGHIYNYGTEYLGGAPDLSNTYTAFAYTPSGHGYTLMDSVGHIYNYGDSAYRGGSPRGAATPMRGLAHRPGGTAYTQLDATGHVYNYGTAYLGGGPAGATVGFIGMVYTPTGKGYALADGAGHVYNYGDSLYRGGIDGISGPVNNTSGVVGDVFADSQNVACAPGSRDVGVGDGWHRKSASQPKEMIRIRLCSVTDLPSTSEESTPASKYYVGQTTGRTDRWALVNARMSGPAVAMVRAARNSQVQLSVDSSYRTMAHQQKLCSDNPGCTGGDYRYIAEPGTSNHQMGLAIDFAMPHVKGGTTCATRATQAKNAMWTWLSANAAAFGFHQYSVESWHWDVLTGGSRC